MKQFYFLILLTFGFTFFGIAQVSLPFDFETSPVTSDFTGFDGGSMIVEPVSGPQSTGNTSTNLAKLVRNGGEPWAGAFTVVDTALDFSVNSTITARIWTDAPIGTKIMFKTEEAVNPGNNSGEKDVFTTKTGEWEDLVFDFSGVTNANQNKLVFIPDNGNVGDGSATSTYYFDDITQAAPPPPPLDLPFDFETSPVTSDFTGFDGGSMIVEPVSGPQSTGNTSTNLAKLVRNGGEPWAGAFTVVDTALDFSVNSTITARIWTDAPIGTKIMFKTEEAVNPGNNSGEKDVFTTKTGEWEDLVFDFSGVTNANQNKLVFIPDNGNVGDGSATSTYYFDDITQAAPPPPPLDLPFDFETSPVTSDFTGFDGGSMIVEPVSGPQSTGNTSTNLAKLVRNGGEPWAGASTVVDTALDFSVNSTITARIWTDAPIGTKIMFKTEEAVNPGNNSGEKDVFTTKTGEWEDLVFDFSGVTNANQNKLVFIPDNGNVGDGSATSTYYFDDITQAAPPPPPLDLPFDFETSPVTSDFTGFDGGSMIVEPVSGPQSTGNTSTNLAKLVRNGGEPWAGASTVVDTALDFSVNSTITARIWTDAPIGTKIMFKTEEAVNPGNNSGEKDVFTTKTGEWEDLVFDFSGVTNANQNKLVFIPDNGNVGDGSATSTYYFDDITQAAPPPPPLDLPFDFETSPVTSDFTGFDGGSMIVEPVSGPQSTGNTSTNLAKLVRNGGEPWAGASTVVDTALDFSVNSTITARIWTDAPIGTKIMFKTEEAVNPGNNSGEKDVFTTKTGEWEDLVFDFSGVTNANQNKLVFIPDNGNVGDGSATSTYYFDDITQAPPPPPPPGVNLPITFESGDNPNFEDFNGSDTQIIPNPYQEGGNTSTEVAQNIVPADTNFAGVSFSVETIDLSQGKTFNLDVRTILPDAPILLKLENTVNGTSIEREIVVAEENQWENITFDFGTEADATYDKVTLFMYFNSSATITRVAYWDNLEQNLNDLVELPVTFESTTANYNVIGFEGADAAVEANPDPSGENTSDTVVRSTKTEGAQFFAGTAMTLDVAIDFSESESISIKTWSPKANIPVRLKLEGSAGEVLELDVNTTVESQWETLTWDFTGQTGEVEWLTVVLFFEFVVDLPGDGSTYYYDDIQVAAPEEELLELPVDFESTTIDYNVIGFEGADAAVEANPDPSGENTSDTVVRSTKTEGAQFFAGTAMTLDVAIDFSESESISIKTWSPKANIPVRLKLEGSAGEVLELDVNTTVESPVGDFDLGFHRTDR